MHRRRVLQLGGGAGAALFLARQNPLQASGVKFFPLKFQAWLADGTPLGRYGLNQLYFLDLQDEPLPNPPRQVELGVLRSQVPPTLPFAIALRLPVDGFGEVTLYADGDGRGYTPATVPSNLNLAFAQTRIHRVQSALRQWQSEGFRFSAGVEQRLQRAIAALRLAESESSLPMMLRHCNAALVDSLWAGEVLVLEKARQTIRNQPRRGDVLFGCNGFGHPQAGANYDAALSQLFNLVTIPFYWKPFETEPGQTQFAERDGTVDWLQRQGITPKGHPLAWFHEIGIPDWVRSQPYERIKALLRQRIIEITTHYGDRIPYYDVMNEAHGVPWSNELHFSPEQLLDLTRLATVAARQGSPNVVRIVNCCCLWAENVAYNPPPQRSPYQYLKACIEANIAFEAIGLQLYYPDQDLFEMDRLLERFIALGKPIHITEMGVSSATGVDEQSVMQSAVGLWHEPWSERIQADWVEQVYTICYSKLVIRAVGWWDLSDRGCFWPFGGLLDREFRPKEAFLRLKNLLAAWR
ncbi:MAG: endo-1,4-beta-xylanase [Thermosynechococcaceae cyanobacterium]